MYFENDTLKYAHHDEGRIILTGTMPEYQYDLKDHLGNVRMTFTSKAEVDSAFATLETTKAAVEQSEFLYYNEAVKVNATIFDHTNAGGTYYSTRLNGSTLERSGLAKSLSVMAGDTINAKVYVKYLDPNHDDWINTGTDLVALLASYSAPAAGTFVDGGMTGSTGGQIAPFLSQLNKAGESGGSPKAFLNYLVFDRDYHYLDGGFVRVTTDAREYGQDGPHQLLESQFVIKQPGYVYIYLSNDNVSLGGSAVEVYFDDFEVNHIKSPVVQSQDYYPFGLTYNSYSRENSVPNKIKFQGQEHVDDLGLNWDSFKWRNHQPDIGRFFNVDPLAEKYPYWTPYAFSGNQVVNARELEGLEPYTVTGRSFIPMKTLNNPQAPVSNIKSFKGDDRSFDPNAKSFRTEQKVRVDFDNKKVTTLNNTASSPTGLDSKGNVVETGPSGKAGPTPTYNKGAMEKGNTTTINMQTDASNPLVPGAPAINYDVNITISQQQDGSVNYNMTGNTDGFPAYEFYITNEANGQSTMIYGSNPNQTGDTPLSLFPPMEKTVNQSGNTGDKKTDDKKKTN